MTDITVYVIDRSDPQASEPATMSLSDAVADCATRVVVGGYRCNHAAPSSFQIYSHEEVIAYGHNDGPRAVRLLHEWYTWRAETYEEHCSLYGRATDWIRLRALLLVAGYPAELAERSLALYRPTELIEFVRQTIATGSLSRELLRL